MSHIFFAQINGVLFPLGRQPNRTQIRASGVRIRSGRHTPGFDFCNHFAATLATTAQSSNAMTFLRETLALGPVIDFLRPYSPDLIGWFRDFGQSAANYDANGHYARVMPIVGIFDFEEGADGSSTLVPVPPSQRLAGLQSGFTRRCPGAASQPRPHASTPFAPAGFDCDREDVLPGP